MEAATAAKVKTEDADTANGVQGGRIAHTLTACCRCRTVRRLVERDSMPFGTCD